MAFIRELWARVSFDYDALAEKIASKVLEHLTNDIRPIILNNFPPPLNDSETPQVRNALVVKLKEYFKLHDEKATGISLIALTKPIEDSISEQLAHGLSHAVFADEKDIVSDDKSTLLTTLTKKMLQNPKVVDPIFEQYLKTDLAQESIDMKAKATVLKDLFIAQVEAGQPQRALLYFQLWDVTISEQSSSLLKNICKDFGKNKVQQDAKKQSGPK